MTKTLGTVSMGIRAPVIREGDDIVELVTDSLLTAVKENKLKLQDNDIVSVTEAIVARAQGNYASLDQIAADVKGKFGDKTVGLVFPILSRNRFALVLKGIARGVKKLVVQLSYPADEVGNHLVTLDMLDERGINPYTQSFTSDEFKKIFPEAKHIFTGVDYIEFYKALGDNIEIVLSNDPCYILNHAKNIICADIHSRKRTAKLLTKAGAEKVCDLTNILNESVNGSGYQSDYGLLGSNFASSEKVKLFPRDGRGFALALQENILKKTC